MKQVVLRPGDVPVALRLAERPQSTFNELREDLGISVSTAHEAVQRLNAAGLLYPHERKVNRTALMEFLEHGIRYAFPATAPGHHVRGVPTAHAGPALAGELVFSEAMVWPSPDGTVVGEALQPLYDKAVELPDRCPSVYDAMTLVDALRVGRARERKLAAAKLRERLWEAGSSE